MYCAVIFYNSYYGSSDFDHGMCCCRACVCVLRYLRVHFDGYIVSVCYVTRIVARARAREDEQRAITFICYYNTRRETDDAKGPRGRAKSVRYTFLSCTVPLAKKNHRERDRRTIVRGGLSCFDYPGGDPQNTSVCKTPPRLSDDVADVFLLASVVHAVRIFNNKRRLFFDTRRLPRRSRKPVSSGHFTRSSCSIF